MRELNARGKKMDTRYKIQRCDGDNDDVTVISNISLFLSLSYYYLQISISLCCVYRFFVVENVMESVTLFCVGLLLLVALNFDKGK